MVRTRIAPSPTGQDIHIGNLYTALINFVFARKNNGQFVIRIEDTDQTRLVKGSADRILQTLNEYNITHDEGPDIDGSYGPYLQSQRLNLYKKYAEELVKKGAAYYCFCSKERLDELRHQQIAQKQLPKYDKYCLTIDNATQRIEKGEPYVIRLNVLPNKKISFQDAIRGRIEFNSNDIDDQVLLKSDGYPTYHLGVVVDDHLMNITHVIRAEEWITSTPKHVMIYSALGWELPIFAHIPILRNPDKSKLSKRKNPVWASWYLEEGFLPEAVLNYLALMGWSHPAEQEIFTLDEFIQKFELKDIKPVGPVFDIRKLTWMNGEYIRSLTINELKSRLVEFYKNDKEFSRLLKDPHIDTYITLAQSRIKTLKDFKTLLEQPEEKSLTKDQKELAQKLFEYLNSSKISWEGENLLDQLKRFKDKENTNMKTLYYLITGKEQGLPLIETMEIRGKENVLQKLQEKIT